MSDETDGIPLDGEAELTPDERKALRSLIRDRERESWAWRRLRVIMPAVVAVVVGIWQAIDWIVKHVKVTP